MNPVNLLLNINKCIVHRWNNAKSLWPLPVVTSRTGRLCKQSGSTACGNEGKLSTSEQLCRRCSVLPAPAPLQHCCTRSTKQTNSSSFHGEETLVEAALDCSRRKAVRLLLSACGPQASGEAPPEACHHPAPALILQSPSGICWHNLERFMQTCKHAFCQVG